MAAFQVFMYGRFWVFTEGTSIHKSHYAFYPGIRWGRSR